MQVRQDAPWLQHLLTFLHARGQSPQANFLELTMAKKSVRLVCFRDLVRKKV